jgi:hypothetical protein
MGRTLNFNRKGTTAFTLGQDVVGLAIFMCVYNLKLQKCTCQLFHICLFIHLSAWILMMSNCLEFH